MEHILLRLPASDVGQTDTMSMRPMRQDNLTQCLIERRMIVKERRINRGFEKWDYTEGGHGEWLISSIARLRPLRPFTTQPIDRFPPDHLQQAVIDHDWMP